MACFTSNKRSSFYFTIIKCLFHQKSTKVFILSSISLFDTIEGWFKFKNIIKIFMVLKTNRLRYIDFLIYKVVKKIQFSIHLIQLKIKVIEECQKKSYCFKMIYGSMSLLIVNFINLTIPFCH